MVTVVPVAPDFQCAVPPIRDTRCFMFNMPKPCLVSSVGSNPLPLSSTDVDRVVPCWFTAIEIWVALPCFIEF